MAVSTGVNEALLEEVFAVYTAAEQVMLQKVANRVKKGVTTVGWNESKLNDTMLLKKEIEGALGGIHSVAAPQLAKSIASAYLKGTYMEGDLKLPKTAMKPMSIPYHVQRLILDSNEIVKGASMQILRSSTDIYRHIIADSSIMSLVGVETRLEASQRALNAFAAKGISGFVDKAGRNWEMASYVEMAVRTASSRAALQGHIDRSSEIGVDLMVVSSFGNTCPKCAPWEGKVLSISGKSLTHQHLSTAKAAGLFHPNCKHTLLAYIEGVTELPETETYDPKTYDDMNTQRYNERQIRQYKRIESVAMTPQAAQSAAMKVAQWQQRQREHILATGLRRKYSREGIRNRTGDPVKAIFGQHTLHMDDPKLLAKQQQIVQQHSKLLVPKKAPVKKVVAQPPHPELDWHHGNYSKMTMDQLRSAKQEEINWLDTHPEHEKAKKKLEIVQYYMANFKEPVVKKAPVIKKVPKSTSSFISPDIFDEKSFEQIRRGHVDIMRDEATLAKMKQTDKASIERYTGQSYRDINGYRRRGKTISSALMEVSANLESVLDKFSKPLSQGTIIYRHIDADAMRDIFNTEVGELTGDAVSRYSPTQSDSLAELQKKITGATMQDKGFLSSSYRSGIFVKRDGIQVRMHMPQGYDGGMFVESVSQFQNESEYLINVNQKFKIEGVAYEDVDDGSGGTVKNLILKVVPMK